MKKKTWLLVMDFVDSPKEIKTIYRRETYDKMVNSMELYQDMNENMILALIEIDIKSTYNNIMEKEDGKKMFMSAKSDWDSGMTYEDLKDEMLFHKVVDAFYDETIARA